MIRVKERRLMVDCIEHGVSLGVYKAYKYTDAPSREEIVDSVDREVWAAIDEFFVFDSEDGDGE